jgi:hypothetical protein
MQVSARHAVLGTDASCGSKLFVRNWHDVPAKARAFGDDVAMSFPCHAANDALGDPAILRNGACKADTDCPNHGECVDGLCLFTYACQNDADCAANEACVAGSCQRVVDGTCDNSDDCMGLICANGACVACDDGSHACAAGLACSPNGTCVSPTDPGGTLGGGGGGDLDGGTPSHGQAGDAGVVRGGAFHCALAAGRSTGGIGGVASLLVALGAWLRRKRRATAVAGGVQR